MLMLTRGTPEPIAVPLGGKAVAFVRAATSFEADIAAAASAKIVAALVEGEEAAKAVLDILGDEFRQADFTTRHWLEAALQRIALLELSVLCVTSWKGVGIDGVEIERPDRVMLALLLRDSECALRISQAIRARVHQEVAEGNASGVSPNGGAPEDEAIAPDAGAKDSPAPKEGGDPTASVALK